MEKCNHEYKQWKGQIETCLFCHQILNFKDMWESVTLPNGNIIKREVKVDPNNKYNYKLVK